MGRLWEKYVYGGVLLDISSLENNFFVFNGPSIFVTQCDDY